MSRSATPKCDNAVAAQTDKCAQRLSVEANTAVRSTKVMQ